MFDLVQFVVDCRRALVANKSHKLVREVVAQDVFDPAAVLKGLGKPTRGVLHPLYRSEDLKILNIVWAP